MSAIWADQIQRAALDLPTLARYEDVRLELANWLEARISVWIPVIQACLAEYGYPDGALPQAVADLISSWFVLMAVSGPLDDYVDEDKVHVHSRSAWARLGRNAGTFVAIALICDCLARPLRLSQEPHVVKAVHALAQYARDVSSGQALDTAGVDDLDSYEAMIALKNGAMFEALFHCLGFLAPNGNPDTLKGLEEYGSQVGLALQMINDYRGIWCTGQFSRDQQGDLQRTQLTYPVLYGLNTHHPHRNELTELLSVPPNQRDVARLRQILTDMGAEYFMAQAIKTCRLRCAEALRAVKPATRSALLEWFDANLMGEFQELSHRTG